jgi:hypothetical protein
MEFLPTENSLQELSLVVGLTQGFGRRPKIQISQVLEDNSLSFVPVVQLLSQPQYQSIMTMDFHVKGYMDVMLVHEVDMMRTYIEKELQDGLGLLQKGREGLIKWTTDIRPLRRQTNEDEEAFLSFTRDRRLMEII